jgi:hypothetical protein
MCMIWVGFVPTIFRFENCKIIKQDISRCDWWNKYWRKPSAQEYNWATLFLGDIRRYGKLAIQVRGGLRWDSKAWFRVLRYSDHSVITLQIVDPSSRQRGRPTETWTQISHSNIPTGSNIWSQVPQGYSIARHTDWLTDWLSDVPFLLLKNQHITLGGTRYHSGLRYCATRREVMGSILDQIFSSLQFYCC